MGYQPMVASQARAGSPCHKGTVPMIKTFPIYWILIALVLPGAVARAAEENSARAGIGPVEPFIDGQTILVARLDTTRINFDSIEQWLGQAGQAQASVQNQLKPVRQWVENVRNSGGKSIYGVLSFGDTAGGEFFVVAPVENGVDARTLETALASLPVPHRLKTAHIGNAILLSDEPTLQKLNNFMPAPRPDIARAMVEDPAAALTAVVAPSNDTRKVIEAVMPRLPREMGGGPSTVLTHGLQWGTLNVHLPPQASLKFVAQS